MTKKFILHDGLRTQGSDQDLMALQFNFSVNPNQFQRPIKFQATASISILRALILKSGLTIYDLSKNGLMSCMRFANTLSEACPKM